jgi:hypothetical protein
MTPEDARDFNQKLLAFAKDLSPKQRDFLVTMLSRGAESAEVEGYTWHPAATPYMGPLPTLAGTCGDYCSNLCSLTCQTICNAPCGQLL